MKLLFQRNLQKSLFIKNLDPRKILRYTVFTKRAHIIIALLQLKTGLVGLISGNKAFGVKMLSMASFLMERIFWLTSNRGQYTLSGCQELQLKNSVPPVQYMCK